MFSTFAPALALKSAAEKGRGNKEDDQLITGF